MRWQAYLESLPATMQVELVDALSIGCGQLGWAARLIRRDAEAVAVAESLEEAQATLLYCTQLLNPALRATAACHQPASPPMIEGSWKSYLCRCSIDHGVELVMAVDTAIAHGNAASQAVLADELIDDVRRYLIAAVTALAQARKLLGEHTLTYPLAFTTQQYEQTV